MQAALLRQALLAGGAGPRAVPQVGRKRACAVTGGRHPQLCCPCHDWGVCACCLCVALQPNFQVDSFSCCEFGGFQDNACTSLEENA